MRGTPRFEAGSRFKYTPDKIKFSYSNLVEAITEAINKQAEEDGAEFITEKRENIYSEDSSLSVDFDDIMIEFNSIVTELIEKDDKYYAPRITEIVDKHLGKGKKVSNCTRDQVMLVDIILTEIKELIK